MEKRTEVETQEIQNNSKLWLRIISVVLSVAMVAIICLVVLLFTSNDKITALQTELNGANQGLEALKAENKAAELEIDALQVALATNEEEMEQLTAELASVKEALTQSKEKQASLEKSNQSAQNEINQLKGEIAALKDQLKGSDDKIRIYIDQGHNPTSYHNSGASGNGLYEQDITFLVGCILADILKSDGRFEVQLSRPNKSVVLGTDDKSSLMARVEGAAAFEADYLISLHTNSFEQNTAHGIEIYVEEEAGESYILAESLLTELVASTNLRKRDVKLNPDFDILEFSAMPAVLVEMGFISNSTDAALMSEHPELFAKGIYNGILDYFGFLPSASVAG